MNDEEKLIDSYKRYINYIEQQIDDYYKLDDSDDSFYKEEIEQGELSLILLRKILKLIKDLKFKNEVYKKKAKIDENVIDEMAKKINQAYFDENNMCIWFEENIVPKNKEGEYDLKDLGTRKNRIKQYFIRKVENENV